MRRVRTWILCLVALAGGAVGCRPDIGDDCVTSIDCSQQGDRLCDTSQPEGYCTVFNCEPDQCPEEAVCVGFGLELDPVCGQVYDPAWTRFERSFCMLACEDSSDCREGYACVSPGERRALSIDLENELRDSKVCFVASSVPIDEPGEPPPSCSPTPTDAPTDGS
jgi:hypothetical protein